MSSDIQIFNNPQFGEIRTAGTAENPIFCLVDVCKVLDLDPSQVARRLDSTVFTKHPADTGYGIKEINFVNEDGLYDVILDSRKAEAKAFRKWVTSEVLPTIRKQGSYSTAMASLPDFTNPAEAARAWAEQYELKQIEAKRADEAEAQVLMLTNELEELAPKVSYYDTILASKNTVTTTQIAQDYGMSAIKFNKILEELRVQRKVNGQWILYAPYIGKGYVHSKPFDITRSNGNADVVMNTEWTQKGRLFLYECLKNQGILPMIEQ